MRHWKKKSRSKSIWCKNIIKQSFKRWKKQQDAERKKERKKNTWQDGS